LSQDAEPVLSRIGKNRLIGCVGGGIHVFANLQQSVRVDELCQLDLPELLQLIEHEIDFYVRQYIKIRGAGKTFTQSLEHIYYNAQNGFTQQYQLLLAPLLPGDHNQAIQTKLRMVAIFLDILLTRRIWNFRSTAYSTMQYAMFILTKEVRRKTPEELAHILTAKLTEDEYGAVNRFSASSPASPTTWKPKHTSQARAI